MLLDGALGGAFNVGFGFGSCAFLAVGSFIGTGSLETYRCLPACGAKLMEVIRIKYPLILVSCY